MVVSLTTTPLYILLTLSQVIVSWQPLQHLLNKNRTNPLPGGLAGTVWEPSKLPNYVSVTPPSKTVVSLTPPPPTFTSISLSFENFLYKKTASFHSYERWKTVPLIMLTVTPDLRL
jgi:uncharacterized membrane protein